MELFFVLQWIFVLKLSEYLGEAIYLKVYICRNIPEKKFARIFA